VGTSEVIATIGAMVAGITFIHVVLLSPIRKRLDKLECAMDQDQRELRVWRDNDSKWKQEIARELGALNQNLKRTS